jgi:hypothetical protein
MFKLIASIAILLFAGVNAKAQTLADSTLKPSTAKTLSDVEYNALLKGDDIYNLALVADINKYPSAEKALKFKKQLDLSPTQVTSLTSINTGLQRKKKEMGNFIIINETRLDALFRVKKINESDLIFYTNRYGLYQGELRNAILNAAVKTYSLLSPQQVKKLNTLK